MRVRDKVRMALRNIVAGRQMAGKIVFGMMFVFVLLLCSLISIQSFIAYTDEFNDKHSADCYYYEEIEIGDISTVRIVSLVEYSLKEKVRHHAEETSVLCTIHPIWKEEELTAGSVGLSLDDSVYPYVGSFIFNRKPYQNIYGETAPIEMALYQEGISGFPNKLMGRYKEDPLLGNYPEISGEIMLDTHILEAYGIEAGEELLGKKVTIYDLETKEVLLEDYILAGILEADFLSVRESLTADDYHLEHIYVNLFEEDRNRFVVSKGSIRYYFNDFAEYVKYCEGRDHILRLDMSQVYVPEYNGVKLTEKGIEYCLLYWIMHGVGKLLALIAAGVGIIVTFSVFYIIEFYRNRNDCYFAMLEAIGMERRDRVTIFTVEICFMMLAATGLSIYLSILFLMCMNFFTTQALDFHIVLDVKVSLLAIALGWVYFFVCMGIFMGRGGLSREITTRDKVKGGGANDKFTKGTKDSRTSGNS